MQANRINRSNELIHDALKEYSMLSALEALLTPASEFQQLAQGGFLNHNAKSLDLVKAAVTAIRNNAKYSASYMGADLSRVHTLILSSLQAKAQMQDALYELAAHIGMPITEKFLKTYDNANDSAKFSNNSRIHLSVKHFAGINIMMQHLWKTY